MINYENLGWVCLFSGLIPFVVYFSVLLGTLAYHRGKSRSEEPSFKKGPVRNGKA